MQFLPAFKDQVVSIFGFWGWTVSVATTQLHFVGETAIDSAHLGGHGCVPGKLFTATGPGSSLVIPEEKTELSGSCESFPSQPARVGAV